MEQSPLTLTTYVSDILSRKRCIWNYTHLYLSGITSSVFVTFYLSLLLIWQIGILVIMPSDGHSTVCGVEKVDDYDYDKESSEGDVAEEPIDFPEGGTRAWMTVIGRFDLRTMH